MHFEEDSLDPSSRGTDLHVRVHVTSAKRNNSASAKKYKARFWTATLPGADSVDLSLVPLVVFAEVNSADGLLTGLTVNSRVTNQDDGSTTNLLLTENEFGISYCMINF